MKYIIVDEEKNTKSVRTRDSLMFESCARVDYVISEFDIKLTIDGYFFNPEDITEFIEFLTAAREHLLSKQK